MTSLRPSANRFQASVILAVSIIGALVGYLTVANARWIAAACGVIFGMIIATFVSGCILMFRPQEIPTITKSASANRYRKHSSSAQNRVCVLWHRLRFCSRLVSTLPPREQLGDCRCLAFNFCLLRTHEIQCLSPGFVEMPGLRSTVRSPGCVCIISALVSPMRICRSA